MKLSLQLLQILKTPRMDIVMKALLSSAAGISSLPGLVAGSAYECFDLGCILIELASSMP